MHAYRLVCGDRTIIPCVRSAGGVIGRMRGLLGRAGLPSGEGLLLSPCNSIHTWFMRFSIDVIFADANWRVVSVRTGMGAFCMAIGGLQARHAVEVQSGWADLDGVEPGQQLALVETEGAKPGRSADG